MLFTAEGKESFWTYDAKGNRLSETESTGGTYTDRQKITYYPNTDLIKQYGEWCFNYDRNGSLIAKGKSAEEKTASEQSEWENLFALCNFDATAGEVWYYEYDMSGRMTRSSSSKKGTERLTERATYAYDWRGLLVSKTYAGFAAEEGVKITGGSTATVTEWYEYNQDGQLIYTERQSGSEVKKTDFIWAETTLWCEVDDGEVYYHHTDHLCTTEAVTDEKGKIVWHAEYEAFGSVLSENGTESFTPSFTGKMLDECSGLYYFNARWYDSEMGRFTSQDPARDGENWYAYCSNNPLKFIDPTGLAHFEKRAMNTFGGIYWPKVMSYTPGTFIIEKILDKENIELCHEQLFFDDGSGENIGFGWSKENNELFSEVNIDNYEMDNKYYDDNLIRQA